MGLQRNLGRLDRPREFESGPIAVLIVDDDEEDALLTRDLLDQIEGTLYAPQWVEGYAAALANV
jgi:hypothetical protein